MSEKQEKEIILKCLNRDEIREYLSRDVEREEIGKTEEKESKEQDDN